MDGLQPPQHPGLAGSQVQEEEDNDDNVINNDNDEIMARSATQRLMGEVDNLVTQCANEMWSHWSNTNMSFQQRIKVPSSRYESFAALVIIV